MGLKEWSLKRIPMAMSCSTSSRLLSTDTAIWNLLRSHSPPLPLETVLNSAIPNPNHSLISSIITSSPSSPSSSDLLLSLRFFVWSGLRPLHRHSPAIFSLASSSLRLHLHPHLLHHLLTTYLSENSPVVSLKTFKILLSLSNHCPLPFPFPLALSLLTHYMPLFSIRPDVPIFNSLLSLPSTPASSILPLFHHIKSSGLCPDNVTYSTAITKLSSSGHLDAARTLLDAMSDDGCSPNVVIYSAVLNGACSRGDIRAGLEILTEMEVKCPPNVVSYTCLMECLCEKGKLEEALGLLDMMVRKGCRPNRVTMRVLIKGLCDAGRVGDAYKMIEQVVGVEGSASSKECYSLLVVCLLRAGDSEGAEGLLGRMLELGVRPDGAACNSLVREICKVRRRFLEGYRWIRLLQENAESYIDSDVYSCVLAGLCEEGHMVEAVKLCREMLENGVRVDDDCTDCVAEAMEKIQEADLASHARRIKEESSLSV